MKYIYIITISIILLIGSLITPTFTSKQFTLQANAQSSIESIKARIKSVVWAADGKVSRATKVRLLELISNKIKASPNAIITEVYIYFLKEVKKMRTSDEIIAISDMSQSNTSTSSNQSTTNYNLADFSISFANVSQAINIDDKYAPISVKIKNSWLSYNPDSLGSLKFGCKGIDGNIYPYWSYVDSQIIWNNSELSVEIPNVFIGHLTASKWFKLLNCKIDSSDLIDESNEDNNSINISIQIY